MEKITEFTGEYLFLSNFYLSKVEYDGLIFQNVEAAFQSSKITNKKMKKKFCQMNPIKAKLTGEKLETTVENWEELKFDIMEKICYNKFTSNEVLKNRLLKTENKELINNNMRGDTIWGISNGIGENHLGRILMKIREELKVG